MWLVEATDELGETKRRYSIHPLTRAFAEAKLEVEGDLGKQARLQAAGLYLTLAQKCVDAPRREAFRWFDLELANLLSSLDWAQSVAEWAIVAGLAAPLMYFLGVRGYWGERIKYGSMGAAAARQTGDEKQEAWFVLSIAWTYQKQDHLQDAEDCARQAEVTFRKVGDRAHLAQALGIRAGNALRLGELTTAQALTEEAIGEVRDAGQDHHLYRFYAILGDIALRIGNGVEAEKRYREALAGFEKLGLHERIASRHIDLGDATLMQGRLDEAREYYRLGLDYRVRAWAGWTISPQRS
jgi:tetratricopeptide (TPR) repeat protein